MVETLQGAYEFEQNAFETEKTYLPLFDSLLGSMRPDAVAIEQIYLSHPSEEFNLRVRESLKDGIPSYTATLKSKGAVEAKGLRRLEIETDISPETYALYKSSHYPAIKKIRAEPHENVMVDWFEDGYVHLESEHPVAWINFLQRWGISETDFIEITGDKQADSEWRAHLLHRKRNLGHEAFMVDEVLSSEQIAFDILQTLRSASQATVTIAGRSGSGKSTIIRDLQYKLHNEGIDSNVLSTDDYHRGKSWLDAYKGSDWTDWDDAIVYDIAELKRDLDDLRVNRSVVGRQIDFDSQEPQFSNVLEPAPVTIVEGLFAGAPSLAEYADHSYELPTPLATCVGRRIMRDIQERPQFADPKINLKYILENAEPAYQAQSRSR